MSIDHLSVASHQTGDLKPELADRGTHPIYSSVVLARVARVFYKPLDRPDLDTLGGRLGSHTNGCAFQVGL